jgi:hypothetical protein
VPIIRRKNCVFATLGRPRLKCDGTCAETRFRLSAKRTSPFKSAGASVQSTTGSRGVRISGSNAGYTMFQGTVKSTGYPLHLPVSPSLPLPTSLCAITFQLDSTCYSVWMTVWYAPCISDSHPYRITSTKCHKNIVVSPDDGHIVGRNM